MNKDVDKYLTHHYPAFKGKDDYINFTYEGLYEMLVDFKKAVLPQVSVSGSLPTGDEIDKASFIYATKHSNAPDKETPDWIQADFKAGVQWLLGCLASRQ